MLGWKTERFTLYAQDCRAVAAVTRTTAGWGWYLVGQDVGGDTETVSEAMDAAEKAAEKFGIKTKDSEGVRAWENR